MFIHRNRSDHRLKPVVVNFLCWVIVQWLRWRNPGPCWETKLMPFWLTRWCLVIWPERRHERIITIYHQVHTKSGMCWYHERWAVEILDNGAYRNRFINSGIYPRYYQPE